MPPAKNYATEFHGMAHLVGKKLGNGKLPLVRTVFLVGAEALRRHRLLVSLPQHAGTGFSLLAGLLHAFPLGPQRQVKAFCSLTFEVWPDMKS